MDLCLDSASTMCELIEVATGQDFKNEAHLFGHPVEGKRLSGGPSTRIGDHDKAILSKKAMTSAQSAIIEGRPVKRMKLGPTAVSRRVTETMRSTFGHQPRKQAYGRRRWKTDTGALVVAARSCIANSVEGL